MIGIIINNMSYDLAYMYGIGSIANILPDLVKANSTDFVSSYEKAQSSVEAALQKFIDEYDKD